MDEVLVKIHATTVSGAGLRSGLVVSLLSRSISGIRRPRQRILGGDLTGEIEAVGPAISEFAVGEHVFGRTGFGSGRTRSSSA
jgi:NADPH:quinone reductase-like Zn-dependent oxidoreductase